MPPTVVLESLASGGTGMPVSVCVCIASRALRGGARKKRNLLAPSPWCCKQRRAMTTYRLPPPLGAPPLLNV